MCNVKNCIVQYARHYTVHSVQCALCNVQCAMCKVLSGCDRGRRALVALLEVEALAGLRMHCCDSYHWPKAPREIYDETRTHNTKGRRL